ncbi:hypothetical protein KUL49_37370 [Alteromonas sp. KUL49]|nr:hypothetical protein KUL49_37370 [Alteromonas sp. KUL49]
MYISSTGSEIQVGLIIFSGNEGAPFRSDTSAYDNFSITFNTIEASAPMSVSLVCLSLVGIDLLRRRKESP